MKENAMGEGEKKYTGNEKIRNEKLEMRNCGVRCADDFKR